MPNFQPDLVLDENRSTGWARVEIYGDKEYGKALVPFARTVLGQMKCNYGVNERQVEDNEKTGGGGFFHEWKRLADGSQVHAISNDGHDTIRIYANRPGSEEKVKVPREDEYDPGAYLWVGIRGVGTYKDFSISSYLIEPATADSGYRGCITQAFGMSGWVGNDIDVAATTDGTKVTIDYTQNTLDGGILTLEQQLDEFQRVWGHNSLQDHDKTRGLHNLAVFVQDKDVGNDFNASYRASYLFYSANGLMMSDFTNVDTTDPDWLHPFDPRMTLEENHGLKRDTTGIVHGSFSDQYYTLNGWDVTYWIDPFDFKKKGDTNTNQTMLAMTKWLRDNKFIPTGKKQILQGTYYLLIQSYDDPPETLSGRAGQDIPSFPGFGRSDTCDYSNYNVASPGSPLQVEVEIRIGKAVYTQRTGLEDPVELEAHLPGKVFNFTLDCTTSDSRNCVNTPLGWSEIPYDQCGGDGGRNMTRGPSLSQVIAIDINAQTATITDELPLPFFGNAGYYHPPVQQKRYPVRVYVYGAIFPATDDTTFANLAGPAVYNALEAMSSGVYGCDEMQEYSAGDITGLITGAGGFHDHVYRFDPASGTIEDLGPWDGVGVGYTNPPDDPNFDWFYPYAIADHNACFNTMGVLVISTGSAFYEGSQNFRGWPGHNDDLDCCTA